MDVHQLNLAISQLLDKKIELSNISYDDKRYDVLEEEVHDLEDDITDKYGQYLEEKLYEVHDEFCPDSEILLPIAYIPNKVSKEGEEYKVDFSQGVYVDADDFPEKNTKLVLLPNPLRIILQIDPDRSDVVWKL